MASVPGSRRTGRPPRALAAAGPPAARGAGGPDRAGLGSRRRPVVPSRAARRLAVRDRLLARRLLLDRQRAPDRSRPFRLALSLRAGPDRRRLRRFPGAGGGPRPDRAAGPVARRRPGPGLASDRMGQELDLHRLPLERPGERARPVGRPDPARRLGRTVAVERGRSGLRPGPGVRRAERAVAAGGGPGRAGVRRGDPRRRLDRRKPAAGVRDAAGGRRRDGAPGSARDRPAGQGESGAARGSSGDAASPSPCRDRRTRLPMSSSGPKRPSPTP